MFERVFSDVYVRVVRKQKLKEKVDKIDRIHELNIKTGINVRFQKCLVFSDSSTCWTLNNMTKGKNKHTLKNSQSSRKTKPKKYKKVKLKESNKHPPLPLLLLTIIGTTVLYFIIRIKHQNTTLVELENLENIQSAELYAKSVLTRDQIKKLQEMTEDLLMKNKPITVQNQKSTQNNPVQEVYRGGARPPALSKPAITLTHSFKKVSEQIEKKPGSDQILANQIYSDGLVTSVPSSIYTEKLSEIENLSETENLTEIVGEYSDKVLSVKSTESSVKKLEPYLGAISMKIDTKLLVKPVIPYNPKFIFHTKLPKSGSTTMNNLLQGLSKRNDFKFSKITPHMLPGDNLRNERPLAKFIRQEFKEIVRNQSVVILKHHFPFDFKPHELQTPTFINVIRDPTSWFQSAYYFQRNGWSNGPGPRNNFHGTETDRVRTVDDCVKIEHGDCKAPSFTYLEYICGNKCKAKSFDDKKRILELTKTSLLERFFTVGILEEFDTSLKLFVKLMPEIFSGVFDILKSPKVQQKIASTKTLNVTKMSESSKAYFRSGPLKYEAEFYEFAKAVFSEQVRKYL